MKFCILFSLWVFTLLGCSDICAQGITNKWFLGYGAFNNQSIQINFSNDSVLIDSVQRKMNFLDLNASICDSHGKMQFYTNGGWIANATNDTIQNGNNLAPGPYATQWKGDGFRIVQGAIIIPFPSDSSRYYLFHETVYFDSLTNIIPCQNLLYSTLDMNLDNGLGAVVTKNDILFSDSLIYGELTACKHANGRDWWIFTHRQNSNLFFKFLITPQGINGPFLQNIGAIQTQVWPGQTCISPNGKKFARYTPSDDLDIYDFDRCSGMLSHPIHISINDTAYTGGLAFSSSSQFLYVSSYNYVYQFDVNDTNIASRIDTVAIYDNFPSNPLFKTYFYLAQLAPNGKIYITAPNGVHYLHVINYPDSAGNACNLVQHGINLKAFNAFTIPNHPNYFLRSDSGSVCDTLMLSNQQNIFDNGSLSISTFPNPAQNYFYIQNKTPFIGAEQFILYNSFGEEVLKKSLQKNSNTFLVQVSDLTTGIYHYTVKSNNIKLKTGNLIIVR